MKLYKILTILAAAAVVVMPSCSDDDTPGTPLTTLQGENSGLSHSSLTFEWDKVAGAMQYGYELYDDAENLVVRSVTNDTDVTITDLKPATEYTLKVWAYAALNSDHTSSEPLVLKATTAALKALGKPTLTCEAQGGSYVVTWKSVSNATGYAYSLLDADGETVESGTQTSRTLTFNDLKVGNYTITVKATSTKDGYEAEGEAASLDFTVEDLGVWKVEGTYKSAILGKSWTATLVYYDDNNYSLQGWYGVEGYNLNFYYDEFDEDDDPFQITGNYDYDGSSYTYLVPTGRTDLPTVAIYPWYGSSDFSGNQAGGTISINVLNPNTNKYVYDTFTWSGEIQGAPADDYVGTWHASLTGATYITDSGDLEDYDYPDFEVEFTKVDDNTIKMPALYFSDETMDVTINLVDMTLTAQPTTVWTWYTLAGAESDESPIIGKINKDGSLEFTNWNAWFGGWVYFENPVAKFWR